MSGADPERSRRTRRVLVRALVVACAIGVHAHERGARQRVRVDVEVDVACEEGPLGDSITNVVSYETIVEGIRTIAGRGHINLVETLADRIADLCLADARARRARVRVEKLDIYPDAAGVGAEVERRRADAPPPGA